MKIEQKTKEKTVDEPYTEQPNDEWPVPYQLREDVWQKGVRVCALAFRFEKKKALTEFLVGGDNMLPRNFTMAEAETYSPDFDPAKKPMLLFEATWNSRLVPVTLHKDLLEKYGISINTLSDKLLLH